LFSNEQDDKLDNVVNNDIKDFENFLFLKMNLSETTIKGYIRHLKVLERNIGKPACQMAQSDIEKFLLNIKKSNSPKTFNNYLCMLKAYYRDFLKNDYVNDFKHPNTQVKPKILPSKRELMTFYDALPSLKYKVVFLALASSGLRISELLDANIDRKNRIIIPKSHTGNTKKSWISFFNQETANLIEQFEGNPFDTSRNTVAHVFKKVANITGIDISPHTLRSVFVREMSKAGVQDRYIDAFCGRTPQSVLARHYSDYSVDALKEIFSRANIKILELSSNRAK
jgi:site-specific recombinase XerD